MKKLYLRYCLSNSPGSLFLKVPMNVVSIYDRGMHFFPRTLSVLRKGEFFPLIFGLVCFL